MKKLILISSLLASLSVWSAPQVTYFFGDLTYFSGNGTTSMGTYKTLLQRTVDAEKGTIVEDYVQDTDNPENGGRQYKVFLQRDGQSNVFKTYDEERTFEGTVTMEGPAGSMEKWVYDLKVSGGKVKGMGTLNANQLLTDKSFFGKEATPIQKIKEKYLVITEKKYKKLFKGMTKKAW